MAISPWYAGQTLPVWAVTWSTMNLTGATLAVIFQNLSTNVVTTGGGLFTITAGFYGQFTYAPISTDLASAGTYAVQFSATFSNGTLGYSDPTNVIVVAPE
jgi:hypothetical protein